MWLGLEHEDVVRGDPVLWIHRFQGDSLGGGEVADGGEEDVELQVVELLGGLEGSLVAGEEGLGVGLLGDDGVDQVLDLGHCVVDPDHLFLPDLLHLGVEGVVLPIPLVLVPSFHPWLWAGLFLEPHGSRREKAQTELHDKY